MFWQEDKSQISPKSSQVGATSSLFVQSDNAEVQVTSLTSFVQSECVAPHESIDSILSIFDSQPASSVACTLSSVNSAPRLVNQPDLLTLCGSDFHLGEEEVLASAGSHSLVTDSTQSNEQDYLNVTPEMQADINRTLANIFDNDCDFGLNLVHKPTSSAFLRSQDSSKSSNHFLTVCSSPRAVSNTLAAHSSLSTPITASKSNKMASTHTFKSTFSTALQQCEDSRRDFSTLGSIPSISELRRDPDEKSISERGICFEDAGLMETSLLLKPKASTSLNSKNQHLSLEKNLSQDSTYTLTQRSDDILSQNDDYLCDISSQSSHTSEGEKCSILSVEDATAASLEAEKFSLEREGKQSELFPVGMCALEDGDVWRSYIEHPLTASSLPSLNAVGETATTIGILYDFYKVPTEKRILSSSYISDQEENDSKHLDQNEKHRERKSVPKNSSDMEVISLVNLDSISSEIGLSLTTDGLLQKEMDNESAIYTVAKSDHLDEKCQKWMDAENIIDNTKFCNSVSTCEEISNIIRIDESLTYGRSNSSSSSSRSEMDDLLLAGRSTIASSLPAISTGDLFECTIEAPKSLKQKGGEPPMTYVNKGQFYCVALRSLKYKLQQNVNQLRVRSVVQIVFGNSKSPEEQLLHWQYWHSRQHTAKQRIVDIADYKESCMIRDVNEFAHNAFSFSWDASDVAKIFLTCNCLSTDFSAQKGVKGLPLLLQIDTYPFGEETYKYPLHRGICQLKVFCDKGAERKIRDEEKKAKRKRLKSGTKYQPESSSNRYNFQTKTSQSSDSILKLSCKTQEVVRFLTAKDFLTPAFHYIPSGFVRRSSTDPGLVNSASTPTSVEIDKPIFSTQPLQHFEGVDLLKISKKRTSSVTCTEESEPALNKLCRMEEPKNSKNILIYIRTQQDEAFDGLMLKETSLKGLEDAIKEKYKIPSENTIKILKKSKKGILVNVDDNIVRHYSNERTFVIDIKTEKLRKDFVYTVTLIAV